VLAADPVLFDEVLVNLLVNAAKYARAEDGRAVAVGAEGPALFVRDNGLGMPPHLREQAFQLFRRLHPKAGQSKVGQPKAGQSKAGHQKAEQPDGSGAGLAIVRRIVERHGGRIWAEDSPGGGTTMWATFPDQGRELQ